METKVRNMTTQINRITEKDVQNQKIARKIHRTIDKIEIQKRENERILETVKFHKTILKNHIPD